MEMLAPETVVINDAIRPLKRVEYEALARQGFFEDERVELLFGMVHAMAPLDVAHNESTRRVHLALVRAIRDRARVFCQSSFAASEISEPEPDVVVVPNGDEWVANPSVAYLVVEVARSSLERDQRVKTQLYALANVEEYWIVNHVAGVVEVYRDPLEGHWRTTSTHGRGERVAMLRFPDVGIDVGEILPPAG